MSEIGSFIKNRNFNLIDVLLYIFLWVNFTQKVKLKKLLILAVCYVFWLPLDTFVQIDDPNLILS